MRKILLISTVLIVSAFARENPFFSTSENKNLPTSSNQTEHKPPLTSMTYSFPDHSRILKEVTFTFQNVDGSLETRKLEVDQSIDWRAPLILSQAGGRQKAASTTTANSSQTSYDFVQLISSGNQMSLLAKDPMIRHFTLTDPDSVVVDFRHKGTFDTFEKSLNASPYKKVKITNHGKFARVTLTLDGHYVCKVNETNQGSSIVCK
ncbi:MAG: AMIN domain-containing protein [Sulfuricurvum sp.]|nr:AMIN domain-containing protein [Sulfuricurvum sp.]